MKWYEDLMVWVALGVAVAGLCIGSIIVGRNMVIESCRDYRAYKPNDREVVFCMVLPITEQSGIGEKQYLRPEGSKVDQTFKRT